MTKAERFTVQQLLTAVELNRQMLTQALSSVTNYIVNSNTLINLPELSLYLLKLKMLEN